MTYRMPGFYATININPSDMHNPIVKFLSGEEIDIDHMLENDIPNFWKQSLLILSNHAIGVKFFNLYLKAFLETVMGCKDKGDLEGGILGTVKAHYGCIEAQDHGSLNCHMLAWIEGALDPNEIRSKVMGNAEWAKELLRYLDITISNVVPEDPIPDYEGALNDKDPCTLRGVDLGLQDVGLRPALRKKDVSRLVDRVQKHKHTQTCYKYYRPGEERTCRFGLSEDNFRAESTTGGEVGSVRLRCLDGMVNDYNMTMLEAVRCDMDIQFIGSGESAKAIQYEQVNEADDSPAVKLKRLPQKCAYALASHQEMSAQQVMSYLMNFEDHFTSHKYGNLYWASFERFVNQVDPIKEQESTEPTEADEEGDAILGESRMDDGEN